MRVFVTKAFKRFARKNRIDDETLLEAVDKALSGLIDADLGHGLIKQRISRPGQGTRGGYRVIIAFDPQREHAVFQFGFAKSDCENVSDDDEASLKEAAEILLALSADDLEKLLANGALFEILRGDDGEEEEG